jgi:hypothetical protein
MAECPYGCTDSAAMGASSEGMPLPPQPVSKRNGRTDPAIVFMVPPEDSVPDRFQGDREKQRLSLPRWPKKKRWSMGIVLSHSPHGLLPSPGPLWEKVQHAILTKRRALGAAIP